MWPAASRTGKRALAPNLAACLTRLPDFHLVVPTVQAVIGNYAVPILEERSVWGTNDETRTAYLDSQDVARMTMAALRWGTTNVYKHKCTRTMYNLVLWLGRCGAHDYGSAQVGMGNVIKHVCRRSSEGWVGVVQTSMAAQRYGLAARLDTSRRECMTCVCRGGLVSDGHGVSRVATAVLMWTALVLIPIM